jgi:putative DNA primase/helicase
MSEPLPDVDAAFRVSFLRNAAALEVDEQPISVEALAQRIHAAKAPEKGRLPWLKLARFGTQRTEKGSLRHDANVIAITGVEGDYDGQQIAFTDAVEMMRAASVFAILYTSASHTPEAPRWRVLCPFSVEMPRDTRDRFMARLNGLFGGVFMSESWTLSQSYYYGSVAGRPPSQVEVVHGRPIDLCRELDDSAIGKPGPATIEPNRRDSSRSGIAFRKGLALRRAGNSYAEFIEALRTDATTVDWCREKGEKYGGRELKRIWEKVDRIVTAPPYRIDPGAPYATAQLFRELRYDTDDMPTLYHHRGGFYGWNGTAYPEAEDGEIRAAIYRFLDECVVLVQDAKTGEWQQLPVKPNTNRVNNVADALRAATLLPGTIGAPVWLDDTRDLEPQDIIACANGLLHMPSMSLLPRTPAFFTHNALEFGFEPNAPAPAAWLEFLRQLWGNDTESIATLQEVFGYCLGADTSQQKAFLIVGPKRSGKGTIARVLTQLVGADNAVAPTLAGLGTNFGLAPLIGKRVAIISDARLSGRADQAVIAERLLSVTGEDAITIDRKYRDAWTGRLPVRFVVLSNELPKLTDASGALASRFIVFVLTESFFGREDPGLTNRLLAELPGILNWAIEGWRRLRERGYFVQPASAEGAIEELEDLGSPIGAFLRDECEVGLGYSESVDAVFLTWEEWCIAQRRQAGDRQSFGRNLRAAVPGVMTSQPRTADGGRQRRYEGLRLKVGVGLTDYDVRH